MRPNSGQKRSETSVAQSFPKRVVERGAGIVEYVLLVSLIALVALAALAAAGRSTGSSLDNSYSKIENS